MKTFQVNSGLPLSNWYDTDTLMEYVIVQLLLDFFDNELKGDLSCPYDTTNVLGCEDWDCTEQVSRWNELVDLYKYFRRKKGGGEAYFLDIPVASKANYKKYLRDEQEFTKKLTRIVELRGMLWT